MIIYLLYNQTKNRNWYKNLALKDHLTNAPNRRAILHNAQEYFRAARQSGISFSVALIDLDYFKKFNDLYGHEVGDEVLIAFGQVCESVLRKQDVYGRYGGEEWLLALSNTNHEEIKIIFQRIKTQFNEMKIKGVPTETTLCFSMGVAQYDRKKDKSLQVMINRADHNLYKAKDMGRDQVVQ